MMEHEFTTNLEKGRELAGLTQRQLASRTGAAASSICRWEAGKTTPRRDTVERLDQALAMRGRLLQAWERQTNGSILAPWKQDVGRLQVLSAVIELVSPVLVPGLLQSRLYARMVFEEGLAGSKKRIEQLVQERCGRYEELRKKNDPMITAVFPMTALTYVQEHIRREQAALLIELIDAGRLRVHLVPEGSLLAGVTSPFLMFHLNDGSKAASSDHVVGNVIHEDSAGYDLLDGLVKGAIGSALPIGQTRQALGDLL
jgi:DNA-binding XRE family transcriptional regulator